MVDQTTIYLLGLKPRTKQRGSIPGQGVKPLRGAFERAELRSEIVGGAVLVLDTTVAFA
jgi:hypothetical protein